MSATKLNIGKIPISKGEYQEGIAYQRLNQVTMLGSTYQSKIDDNTSAPAQMGADGAVENINTEKWLCIAVGNVSAAKKVVYNNETSGLEAGNVQEAIDEVGSKVSNLSNYIDSISLLEENDVVRHIVDGKWSDKTKAKHQCISCNKGDVFEITKSLQYPVFYSFLKSYDRYSVENDILVPEVDFANGYTDVVSSKTAVTIEAPDDAKYLYIEVLQESTRDTRPTSIKRKLASSIPTIIEQKFDKSNIAQELGDNGDKVLSQKAVSTKLSNLSNYIDSISLLEENDVVRHIVDGKWSDKTKAKHQCISCNKGDVFEIELLNTPYIDYCFLKSYNKNAVTSENPPIVDFATGYTKNIISKSSVKIETPEDAKYLYICVLESPNENVRPYTIKIDSSNTSVPTIMTGKLGRSDIAQELGNSDSLVMSQKAISEKIGKVDDTIKSLNCREFSLDALSGYVNEEGFISNKTIRLIKANNSFCQPIILTSKAKYVGNSAPTIKFNVGAYNSIPYTIGNINKDIQSWRIPPMLDSMPETVVTITVPEDTKLYVSDFSAKYETSQSRTTLGLRFNSHLGFLMYAPEQTIQSLESASLMGYSGCIINPIKTSDNVWMCYHGGKKYLSTDGTVENAIAIADSEFKNYTYEQIRAFSVVTSNSMNKYFKDCKVPTLDEVFELFAKVGMRPIFSVHPAPTSDDWSEIKNKLFKYNLLKYLTIKVFSVADAESAYKVFGDSIDSYVFIIYETTALNVAKMCNDFRNSTVGNSNCRLSIELGAKDSYTEECFNEVLNKGFYITAESFRDKTPNGDSIKNLIRLGASEFTDDENPHSGLNW